ncbi:DUF6090 family protein [Robiginitalea sp. IMCC43444]|uniref:DUF6090 family protein n=1 Tax=Robiginitalea sp. IMCC43444 TaxID=3459121 RepID=UPI0040412247
MIRFFRRIRQKLFTQNKFSKYLFYALGEIILVVIGILIALQINNWNEFNKDREQEKELLTQLQSEFESNLKQLDEKISMRNTMIRASFKILDIIDHPEKLKPDSLLLYISRNQTTPTFDPIRNDLSSSGRIQFLRNAELKRKLSLWTSEIVQVTEEEEVWVEVRSSGYSPYLVRRGLSRSVTDLFWKNNTLSSFQLDRESQYDFNLGSSKARIDFSAVLNDVEFEAYAAQCASLNELTNSQSISLRKRIVEILELIQKELNRL